MAKKYRVTRNSFKKNNNKKVFYGVLILICIVAIFLFFFNKQDKIVRAKYGELVDGITTRALIIRKERVNNSPCSGKVTLCQNEGDRISYGQPVLTISTPAKEYTLYNHIPGIVSYATDNLEHIIKPGNLDDISLDNFNKFERDYRQLVSAEHVGRGEPVFRIVNNYQLYLAINVSRKEAERYRLNEVVFINPQNIDTEIIKGNIIKKTISENRGLLFIKLNRFIDEWLNVRRAEIKFIKNIYRGIIIPRSAVFNKPEGKGVLILSPSGECRFQKIKIEDGTEKQVVVSGLDIGDNVISNPEAYNYGQGR